MTKHSMLFTGNTKATSTRIRFCLKTDIFFFGWAFCPNVSGENGHQKRILSKTLFRVEILKNAILLYSYGRMKTEVFENDYVAVLDPA